MRNFLLALLCLAAPSAWAQETKPEAQKAERDATTLDTLRVTAPRPEVLDLDRFRNPIAPQPTVFDRSMRPPPSLEEIGMNGGVIPLLLDYVTQKLTTGAGKTPGGKHSQPVIARPPPLTGAQMDRAARLQADPPQR